MMDRLRKVVAIAVMVAGAATASLALVSTFNAIPGIGAFDFVFNATVFSCSATAFVLAFNYLAASAPPFFRAVLSRLNWSLTVLLRWRKKYRCYDACELEDVI